MIFSHDRVVPGPPHTKDPPHPRWCLMICPPRLLFVLHFRSRFLLQHPIAEHPCAFLLVRRPSGTHIILQHFSQPGHLPREPENILIQMGAETTVKMQECVDLHGVDLVDSLPLGFVRREGALSPHGTDLGMGGTIVLSNHDVVHVAEMIPEDKNNDNKENASDPKLP